MQEHAESINALAGMVGRARSTVTKWLTHPRFPVQREAPWSPDDIDEIRTWATTLQENRNDPTRQGRTQEPPPDEQTKDYWLMRKYRAQALEQEGELLDAGEVRSLYVSTLATIRERMMLVPASAATLCANKPAEHVEQTLNELIRSTLDGVADRLGDGSAAEEDQDGWREGTEDPAAATAEPMG